MFTKKKGKKKKAYRLSRRENTKDLIAISKELKKLGQRDSEKFTFTYS